MEKIMLNLNKTLATAKETNKVKSSNSTKDFSSTLDSVKNHNKEDNINKVSNNKKTDVTEETKTKATSENEDLNTEEIEEIQPKTDLSEVEIAILNVPVNIPLQNIEQVENIEELNLADSIQLLEGLDTEIPLGNLLENQEIEPFNVEELLSKDINLDKVAETEIKNTIEKSGLDILSKGEKKLDKVISSSNSIEVPVETEEIKLDQSQNITEENKDILNVEVQGLNKKVSSENLEENSDGDSKNSFNESLTANVSNASEINKTSKNEFQPINKAEQPIEAKEVIKQIVQSVKLNVSDLKNEIKLDLKPEALGKLAMTIEVIKGEVTAKIMVDNYRTKEIIEANLSQLKEGSKESNLEIKTVEVYVGNNSDFDKHNSESFNTNQPNKRIKIKPQNSKIANNYDEQTIDKKTNDYGTYNENGLNLFA